MNCKDTLPYIALIIAIVSISSSGVLLLKLPNTPPLLKSFWRLFMHSILMFPLFLNDIRKMNGTDQINKFQKSWISILICSIALAVHFGSWITSLNYTSLAQSFVLVCSHPLLVLLYLLIKGESLSKAEIVATLTGFGGMGIMMIDVNGGDVTLLGNFLAFLGAVAFVFYIIFGKDLRHWMPLFAFSFPVTFLSSLFVLSVSYALENINFNSLDSFSAWGMFSISDATNHSFYIVLLLAIVCGILGTTLVSYSMGLVSPLLVSLSFTLEPVFAVILGLIFNVSDLPQIYTILGSAIAVISTFVATYGTYKRQFETQKVENLEMSSVLTPDN